MLSLPSGLTAKNADLFNMYNTFLRWEMELRKMCLFLRDNDTWECKTHLGIDEALLEYDIGFA